MANAVYPDQKEELTQLIDSLLQDPPAITHELEARYEKIKEIIRNCEAGNEEFLEDFLRSRDADFIPVRRLYPYHEPNFLEDTKSVLAMEYRFFVGGLRGCLQNI